MGNGDVAGDLVGNLREEISLAKSGGCTLEWKVYTHDEPANLGERLLAAGFTRGQMESVLVMRLSEDGVAVFGVPECETGVLTTSPALPL